MYVLVFGCSELAFELNRVVCTATCLDSRQDHDSPCPLDGACCADTVYGNNAIKINNNNGEKRVKNNE
jgi:hypothetical protein